MELGSAWLQEAETDAQEVPSEHEEEFFTVWVSEHWERLPREAVEDCLDIILWMWSRTAPLEQKLAR